jgi:hypothetical protein
MSSRQLLPVGRPLEEYLGYPDLTSFPPPGFNNTPIQLGFVPYQHAQATMHRTSVQQQPLPYRVHPQHSQQVRQAVPARQQQPPYGMLPHPSQFPILSGQSNFAGASAAAQIGPSAILVSQLGCLQWTSRKLWVQWLHSFRTPYESSAAHISKCYTNKSETYMASPNAPFGFTSSNEFTQDIFYPYISAPAVSSLSITSATCA